MKSSQLDIWAIQHDPDAIYQVLEGVKDSPSNMLFRNCQSYLKVGKTTIRVQFDTAFYCEDGDKLILLMKDGKLTAEKFMELLAERKVGYNEINLYNTRETRTSPTKEIWFARDIAVVEDAIAESKSKGVATCDYYPYIVGGLQLEYIATRTGETHSFDCQPIVGAIITEDKIVFNIKHKEPIPTKEVARVLNDNDMGVRIIPGVYRGLPKETLQKVYVKEQ